MWSLFVLSLLSQQLQGENEGNTDIITLFDSPSLVFVAEAIFMLFFLLFFCQLDSELLKVTELLQGSEKSQFGRHF